MEATKKQIMVLIISTILLTSIFLYNILVHGFKAFF